MAISANFGFKLTSVNIRAAFLQSKVSDREVYLKPPSDIKKPESHLQKISLVAECIENGKQDEK